MGVQKCKEQIKETLLTIELFSVGNLGFPGFFSREINLKGK